ncbi:hypothetical protein OH77DRAFT_1420700 [Trametes cingulata]|nr:hypothetical protein OH77DRAFT_1420700 [Trametes cingulata]
MSVPCLAVPAGHWPVVSASCVMIPDEPILGLMDNLPVIPGIPSTPAVHPEYRARTYDLSQHAVYLADCCAVRTGRCCAWPITPDVPDCLTEVIR